MKRNLLILTLLTGLVWRLPCLQVTTAHDGHGKVVLLLIDGMRWDLYGQDLPVLKRVEENGVRADWLDPVFVTFSSPSSFSIATGN